MALEFNPVAAAPAPRFTTSNGAPVDDDQNSLTVGKAGPILLQDFHLIDTLSHFDRERIPERVVHAKGAGAHGYFEVTHDVTKFCKAKFLNKVGKRTPVFVRFSTVGGEKGSPDAARDPRGFAIKHYTEEGVWDMVGNNTPIFFIRDPIKFPSFIHTQKRNPQTNLPDPDAFWDFLSLTPESVHQVMFLFSNRGTPANYREMNGYSSHTLKWVNDKDEAFWVKIHYKPEVGVRNFKAAEAQTMCAADPDHATRDLFNHIAGGKVAAWSMEVQVMPEADAARYKWNVFDVTKVWPHADYPRLKVGRLVLNRNPANYFAEVEQSAFSPSHMVPGIEPSLDRMLQGRLFSYPDTHRHRLGANYQQIPINCPFASPVRNPQRDGFMVVNGNQGSAPNYEPNSVAGAPKTDKKFAQKKFKVAAADAWAARHPQDHPNSDTEQPAAFWNKVLNESEQADLVSNISGHLKNAKKHLQDRVINDYFGRVDKELAARIRAAVQKASL